MTVKRFTIKPSMIVDDVTVIINNQKEYTFPVLDSTLNYMFCKVLNEQYETIQRLKQNIDELSSVDIEEELVKENEQLKSQLNNTSTQRDEFHRAVRENANRIGVLEKENEELKQVLGSILIEVRRDISATNHSGEVKAFVNPNSFDLISDVLKKYGELKEWYE